MSSRTALLSECVALFYLLPVGLYFWRQTIGSLMVPLLLAAALGSLLYLLRDREFDRNRFTGMGEIKKYVTAIIALLSVGTPLFVLYCLFLQPELFLAFPRARPLVWLGVLVLYPVLMVVPQEIIFRCFFFQRYRSLFESPPALIFFNGLSFGLYHVFFSHWQAVAMTLLGGWLFAYRYHVSRSLAVVVLEHGLWGNVLFTIGLGWYFYTGAIR